MTGYMVSTYWSGALNISNMRLFDNELDAKAYIKNILKPSNPAFVRLYKLSDNAEPVKLPFP
jgi:hypothetical protein